MPVCPPEKHGSRSCANCAQRKYTLFDELSISELDKLNNERYEVQFSAGEIIYKTGTKPTGLICLHQGKAKIVRTGPAGSDQILALRKSGDFIGLKALLKQELHTNTAVALEDCALCVIPELAFKNVLTQNPDLSLKVLHHFLDQLEISEQLRINQSQKHMRARLADGLLMIYEVYGEDTETGCLNVQLKRSELAALSNMTTSNAIRILSSFVSEQLISTEKRNIKLLNIPALKFLSVAGR